jgi:hypothetical protein
LKVFLKALTWDFTMKVLEMQLHPKFEVLQMDMYDGSKDPIDHIEIYTTHMLLQEMPEENMCQAFPTTLKGPN